MDDRVGRVSELLREAADLHHRVYRITDGADDDWASWYAGWLTTLSELPEIVGRRPSKSELTYLLVRLDREHRDADSGEPWQEVYAREIVRHFER